eukprot:s450_g6.t1
MVSTLLRPGSLCGSKRSRLETLGVPIKGRLLHPVSPEADPGTLESLPIKSGCVSPGVSPLRPGRPGSRK